MEGAGDGVTEGTGEGVRVARALGRAGAGVTEGDRVTEGGRVTEAVGGATAVSTAICVDSWVGVSGTEVVCIVGLVEQPDKNIDTLHIASNMSARIFIINHFGINFIQLR